MSHHAGLLALCFTAGTALADQVFTDDVIVDADLLCVGIACANGEAEIPGRDGIKIKDQDPSILFEDTTTSSLGNRDWQLIANISPILEGFFLRDNESNTLPFWIAGGAPSNSLHIGTNGFVGIGTSLPARSLHIANGDPRIRLEDTFGTPMDWGIGGSNFNFFIQDEVSGNVPFTIEPNSPTHSTTIKATGNIGMGTTTPAGKLHTVGDGTQLIYFESSTGGAVQVRFRSNSENRRFLAVNNANEVQSQVIFKNNEILFTGATDSGANRWLTIGPSGIISRGPTCNPGPCDATFDPEQFEVPPLKERTAYMWENQHLWAVGPTKPGEPINLTEKTGAMLHELEVAYIYIEQLHDTLEAQQSAINALQADVEALKAR